MSKFVLLEGVTEKNEGCRFFTIYDGQSDPTKSEKGDTWYKIIGYSNTVEEAQIKLYGRSF